MGGHNNKENHPTVAKARSATIILPLRPSILTQLAVTLPKAHTPPSRWDRFRVRLVLQLCNAFWSCPHACEAFTNIHRECAGSDCILLRRQPNGFVFKGTGVFRSRDRPSYHAAVCYRILSTSPRPSGPLTLASLGIHSSGPPRASLERPDSFAIQILHQNFLKHPNASCWMDRAPVSGSHVAGS